MAENNRPQGSSSHAPNSDWDENSTRSNFGSESTQHTSNQGASRFGRDFEQKQSRSNVNNPDYDRDWEQRRGSFEGTSYGRGWDQDQNRGYSSWGRGNESDFNRGNISHPSGRRDWENERSWRGNTGAGNQYWGSSESGRGYGYGSDYNRGNVSNEGYGGPYGRGGSYEGGYNTPDYGYGHGRQSFGGSHFDEGRTNTGSDFGSDYNRRNWGNEGFGSSYSNVGNRRDFGSSYENDYNRRFENPSYGSSYNTGGRWGSERERGYMSGNMPFSQERERFEGRDRNWWDRASDEVASWFGNEDAERRRRMDVVQSNRGRGPRGYKRSDERIREDVNDRLSDDSYVDASDIEVQVNNCDVVLTGKVDSRLAKRRAEDLAESISGVQNVENRIRVRDEPNIERSSDVHSSSPSTMSSSSTTTTTERTRKTS